MTYIEENLQKDEHIIHRGYIHWFVFMPGAFLIIVSLFVSNFSSELMTYWFVGIVVFFIGLSKLIDAYIRFKFTDFAITNRRTIVKTGLISRDVFELNHSKVEGINFKQSIFGRFFDFGTIVVSGTGAGKSYIEYIKHPIIFKNKALEIVDRFDKKTS